MRLDDLANALSSDYGGDAATEIVGLCSVDRPRPAHLGFALGSKQLKGFIDSGCQNLTLILQQKWLKEKFMPSDIGSRMAFIHSESPYEKFVEAIALFYPESASEPGIHATAVVDASAVLAEGVSVGANSVIGAEVRLGQGACIGAGCYIGDGVCIGEQTTVDANVVIYHNCLVGKRCRLHASCVIGAEGFGHLPVADGKWRRIPHHGIVSIGDDVRIGAGTTIDRAVIDATVIESGVKLDDLIHIGHNARIGADTAMAGGTMVSGHANIGKRCRMAGHTTFAGVTVADDTTVLAETGIGKDIREPGTTVLGYFGFMQAHRWRRWVASLRRLEKRNPPKPGRENSLKN